MAQEQRGGSDDSRNSEDLAGPNKAAEVERELDTCSIDVDYSGEDGRICRICHLSAEESGKKGVDLMEVGCGCKGELGVAHLPCAEAWFRVKGNRLCEICGEIARNITGIGDNGFMEEWNETDSDNHNASDERRRCCNRQPLCNFIMSCLVIAFVLPWFFRVNMF
ncbi:hypothetical protein ACS0TY_031492 [Phlomoides rotata]